MKKKYISMLFLVICLILAGCQKTGEATDENGKETEEVSVPEDEYTKLARENTLLKEELKSLQKEILFYEQHGISESARQFIEWREGPKVSEMSGGTNFSGENEEFVIDYPEVFDEAKIEIVIESIEENEKENRIIQLKEENDSLCTVVEEMRGQAENYREMYGNGAQEYIFEQSDVEE